MNTITIPRPERNLFRRLVGAVLVLGALVLARSGDVVQFEASKECRGGAFSAGFGGGFDVHRCDLVVRRIGSDRGLRIPLPQH
jgi:hypothetical protein